MRSLIKYLHAVALMAATLASYAVEPTWSIDFCSVFDNREGDNRYTDTKTFFFTSLAPELGLSFSETDRIAGGVVWNQPIGCEWDGHRVSPTLYYRHDGSAADSPWSFSMGMFPRKQLREEMPGFLWSDSMAYTQRNIRGLLVQYRGDKGFVDAYVDWRGMQTEKQREAFNIVVHGRMQPRGGAFFVGGHAMMNHFALQKNAPDNQHIVDNFVVNPYIGVNLSDGTALDSLMFRAGPLLTLERNRENSEWKTPLGAWAECVVLWRWLGVREEFYAGGRQMPDYKPFASLLYQGEPYYQSKYYSRTDVFADIYSNSFVKLRASLDFHVAQSAFTFYQRIVLTVNLPGGGRTGFFRRK
ncbi:MAG: hypothetical protein OSJ37_05900 [Muribaculaceae bacterium]|jgi:hypothetical protein|nr:hypothetical protein [Muribaculaceae bacterium]